MAKDKYGRLISNQDIRKGTEYGGVDRVIQPPPHNPYDKPSEVLMMIKQTNENATAIVYKDGSTPVEDQPIPETKKIV